MTPKQRMRAALELRTPDVVPTAEIDFELNEALTGQPLVLGAELMRLSGAEKLSALHRNIDVYVQTALLLDYSAITVHPAPTPGYTPAGRFYPTLEDELYVISQLSREAGERFFVAAGIDGTCAIPDGDGIADFSYRMADEPEALLGELSAYVDWAIEHMRRLINAGAQLMYNCSDYCFNQGPFLSPAQFERFIYPFLRRQTQALRAEGAYVVKHTDGNIWPILDMLLDCGPHCIHSVDPIAGMDLDALKRHTSGKCALMGNVNSALLQAGDRAGILQSARQALEQGMQSPGYIFATCNSVFEGIALEDYRLMLGVRDEMGRYGSTQC